MRRLRTFILPVLLITLVGLLPLPAAPALQAAPGQSAFGVNSHIATRFPDPSSFNVPVENLAQLEAGWLREDFQFSRIAPQAGSYDWLFHDNAVDALAARGFNIIGVLLGPTPGWAAQGNPGGDFYAPDPQLFAQFVSAVVSRYKDRVHYWEVWNEPDNERYWKPTPDVVAYANLLKAASSAIRAADPGARILVAGIVSPEPATSWLTTLADNGAWGAFDIISVHPYTDPRGPEEGQIGAAGIGQVKALADRLGSKPIWATEFGWSTGPGGRGGVAFDQEAQANYLVRGSVLLRAAGAERVLWYNLKDAGGAEQYGLFSFGGGLGDYSQPKASFFAAKTLNQQLGNATPVEMLGLGQQNVVLGFEPLGTWRRGDQPNGELSQSSAQVHSGSASAQLRYNFPSAGNDYVVFSAGSPPSIGSPSQLGLWVYGDGSGHALKVWLRDSQNETLQFRLGFVGGGGWQLLSTPVNGQVEEYNRVEGGGNLRLDFPARLVALVLDDEPDAKSGAGTIYLDDLTAISGAEAYGVRFNKGGTLVDVLWAPGSAQVNVPTAAGQGKLTDRAGGSTTQNASNGQFALNLGPSPLYLEHGQQPPSTPPPTPTTPDGEPRCFPETGQCIAGDIRAFWEANGGLSVFGYPTTPQRQETIEGQVIELQWFERNRLELHPENQPPYHVLLGRLGADRLQQQSRDWTTFPKSTAQADCRFFPETGHNVCGEILAAWRASGLELDGRSGKTEAESLGLFGLPLSDAQMETLGDGRQYMVQWFERARFELHPENQPPYNVLLGLLGNEMLAR